MRSLVGLVTFALALSSLAPAPAEAGGGSFAASDPLLDTIWAQSTARRRG